MIRGRCPDSVARCWSGPTSRAFAWTRPCIRWRCCASECTASLCRTRMRAVAHRASVEVWIQEREGNRANKVYREPAGQYLEQSRAERVRFLLQCESECGPSALEPENGKKAGRIFQTPHPDVQWV